MFLTANQKSFKNFFFDTKVSFSNYLTFKAIRNDADSDAIQLAAAQDFKRRGLMDAYYVSKVNVTPVLEFSNNKFKRLKKNTMKTFTTF